jgi:hypothetical protein
MTNPKLTDRQAGAVWASCVPNLSRVQAEAISGDRRLMTTAPGRAGFPPLPTRAHRRITQPAFLARQVQDDLNYVAVIVK